MIRIRKILKVAVMSLCFTAAIGANAGAQPFARYWHNWFLDYYHHVERPVSTVKPSHSTTGSSHGNRIDLSEVSQKKTPEAVEVVSKTKETTVGKSVEVENSPVALAGTFSYSVYQALDSWETGYGPTRRHKWKGRAYLYVGLKMKGCTLSNGKKTGDVLEYTKWFGKHKEDVKVAANYFAGFIRTRKAYIICNVNGKNVNIGTISFSGNGTEVTPTISLRKINTEGKIYVVSASPSSFPSTKLKTWTTNPQYKKTLIAKKSYNFTVLLLPYTKVN